MTDGIIHVLKANHEKIQQNPNVHSSFEKTLIMFYREKKHKLEHIDFPNQICKRERHVMN